MNEYIQPLDIKTELLAQKEELRKRPPTVVKIGGSIAAEQDTTLRDIAFLHTEIGVPLTIVHGGGPEIDKALQESGIETRKIDGLRVTDSATLAVVVSVLDNINNQMVDALKNLGVKAVGYGVYSGLLQAVIEDPRLGFVGDVSSVDAPRLREDMMYGIVPIIAPVAIMQDNHGQLLNINGDTATGAITASLQANAIFATDVAGVLDATGVIIPELSTDGYEEYRLAGVITSGMIPKVQAGLLAGHAGGKTIICQGSNLLYAFRSNPRGTIIV